MPKSPIRYLSTQTRHFPPRRSTRNTQAFRARPAIFRKRCRSSRCLYHPIKRFRRQYPGGASNIPLAKYDLLQRGLGPVAAPSLRSIPLRTPVSSAAGAAPLLSGPADDEPFTASPQIFSPRFPPQGPPSAGSAMPPSSAGPGNFFLPPRRGCNSEGRTRLPSGIFGPANGTHPPLPDRHSLRRPPIGEALVLTYYSHHSAASIIPHQTLHNPLEIPDSPNIKGRNGPLLGWGSFHGPFFANS